MIVCYTSTHAISPKGMVQPNRKQQPPQDVKPLIASMTEKIEECFMRDYDTRTIRVRHGREFKDVRRMFVRLREVEVETSDNDAKEDLLDLEPKTDQAYLVIGLCTVYFEPSKNLPKVIDFAEEIKSRTRLSDQVIVAGYTGDELNMGRSESLALRRARNVRDILLIEGIQTPISTIARPKCCFPTKEDLCHRVEITAIHQGLNKNHLANLPSAVASLLEGEGQLQNGKEAGLTTSKIPDLSRPTQLKTGQPRAKKTKKKPS